MSGFCDFCQIWHSASCCHPGRIILIERDKEITRLTELLREAVKHTRNLAFVAGFFLSEIKGDPRACQFFDLRVIEGCKIDTKNADIFLSRRDLEKFKP